MAGSNSKGDRRERELVNWLDENGWAVMRAPASGSATERELPDVLCGDGETVVAAEVKGSGGDPIYIDGGEIEDLQYFASSFGATAFVAVKFDLTNGDPAWGADRPGFYFLEPGTLHKTLGDNYRVKKATAQEVGVPEVSL